MNLEDLNAALLIRTVDRHVPIESPWPQQRRIEHVGTIRSGQHDHRFRLAESVHLAENLVQRLFPLIMPAAQPGATMATDGVDFVDEQDRRRGVLGGLEHIANAAGADAHEHLNEFRTADGKERHSGLAGDGPGQQSLAGAWRAHQQDALGDASAEALKFFWVFEKLDHLLQIVLHPFQTGDVGKRGRAVVAYRSAWPDSY